MEYLNADREQVYKNRLKEAQSEAEKLQIIARLFDEMRANTDALIGRIEEGVTVNNLDEIKASLHNELSKIIEKIIKEIRRIPTTDIGPLIDAVKDFSVKEVSVLNFPKVDPQEAIKISNLEELADYFDKIEAAIVQKELSVSVEPKVEVKPPDVKVDAPIINVPEVDLTPLKDQLKKIRQGLKPLQNNSQTKPIAVRLSDGREFIDQLEKIVETQRQQIAAFPGQVKLHKNSEVYVRPSGSISDGSKTVTSAGTAEALAAAKTKCRKIIITAKSSNTGKIYVGGSTVSSTSGAFIYAAGSMVLEISDLRDVYIDADVNGEGIQYTYVS